MQLVDFNQYVQNQRMYDGTAGRKIGIMYEGKNYILKFPGYLKEQHMLVRCKGDFYPSLWKAVNGSPVQKSSRLTSQG